MRTISFAIAGLVLLGTMQQTTAQTPAAPADRTTVSSLMNQGYDLVGTIETQSRAPGLFLRKGTKLVLCFISETPQSKTVSTQYCKPVE
jgi:hypothetical protein